MKVFILEDDPSRNVAFEAALIGHDLTICVGVQGPGQAQARYNPPYDLVLLDHDLGGEIMVDSLKPETGAEFCRWMPEARENPLPTLAIIHSYNPGGALNMYETLTDKGYNVQRQPFGLTLLTFLGSLKGF